MNISDFFKIGKGKLVGVLALALVVTGFFYIYTNFLFGKVVEFASMYKDGMAGFSFALIAPFIPQNLQQAPLFAYWILFSLIVFISYLSFESTISHMRKFVEVESKRRNPNDPTDNDADLARKRLFLYILWFAVYLMILVLSFGAVLPFSETIVLKIQMNTLPITTLEKQLLGYLLIYILWATYFYLIEVVFNAIKLTKYSIDIEEDHSAK